MKKYNVINHSDGLKDIDRLYNSNRSRWNMAKVIASGSSLLKIIDFKLMNRQLDPQLEHYLIQSYFKDNKLTEFNHDNDKD